MATNDRLTVDEQEWFYFGGDLSKIIKDLQEKLNDGWQRADCEVQLFRTREETNKEYWNRLKLEARRKEDRLKQYKKLREEFGDLA